MIPVEIAARINNPGKIEKALLHYLEKSGAKVNQSKTIASQILYHQKALNGLNSVEFFTGNLNSEETNIVNFTRPESEHFLIYGIKAYYLDDTDPIGVYETGIVGGPLLGPELVNANISITVNSVRVLKNLPCTEFDALDITQNQGIAMLNEPILWPGQTSLILTLQAKPGVNFGLECVRFELIGIGLI